MSQLPKDSPPPSDDPLVGRVLSGRFTLLEAIGGGTMGRVYRAQQAPLGRIVAIKVLLRHSGITNDPHFKRRFFMEASLTAQLRHPNTIQIIDYGEEGEEILYIAMEYLQGVTLAELLEREGRLTWPRAFSILQQVARSLREAHGHGVIHRDLKPANLMLVHEEPGHDLVKVLDFGLVKAWREGASLPQSDLQMTQKGVILGSAYYMAPEQAHGKGDPRTDVYALGVILFHLLTGKLPFDGQGSMDVIVQHHSKPVPRFADVAPDLDIPEPVEALIHKCLSKRPENRPQDMAALLEEMRALAPLSEGSAFALRPTNPRMPALEGVQVRESPSRPRIEQPAALFGTHQEPRASRGLGWGVFAAALVLGVGAVSLLSRPGPTDAPDPATPVAGPATGAQAAPEPPAAPAAIAFRVETVPPGASVVVDGKPLGVTPLRFERPARETGEVTAEIRLSLEGYFPMTLEAAGSAGEVRVVRTLLPLDRAAMGPRPR